jgi:hypothetical protein
MEFDPKTLWITHVPIRIYHTKRRVGYIASTTTITKNTFEHGLLDFGYIGHDWMTRVDQIVQKLFLIMHKSFDITLLNKQDVLCGATCDS